MDETDLEARARALFDRQPHSQPPGKEPDWDRQPDHIREIFRNFVRTGTEPRR